MAICSLLQNRPSCPTLKSAILSHFRDQRFCLIFEIGGFVSFKILCFVLPPYESHHFCLIHSLNPTGFRPTWPGGFLMLPKKSRRSGFWTSLSVPCPVKSVIGFTAISTLRITTLSMTVKIASCMRLSTVMAALLTALVIWWAHFFSMTWLWRALWSTVWKSLDWPLVCCSKFSLSEIFRITLLPKTKSPKDSTNWLSCFFCWFFFLNVETNFANCWIDQDY